MLQTEKMYSANIPRKLFSHLQALYLTDDLFKEAVMHSFFIRHVGDVMQGESVIMYLFFYFLIVYVKIFPLQISLLSFFFLCYPILIFRCLIFL